MQKTLLIGKIALLFAVSSAILFCFACENKTIGIVVYAESISPNKNEITLEVSQNYELPKNLNIFPLNCTERLIYISSSPKYTEINYVTGLVKAINPGTTTFTIQVKADKTNMVSTQVTVVVKPKYNYPTSYNFQFENVELSSKKTIVNKIVYNNENVNIIPTIRYKNNLVSYNYLTGEVSTLSSEAGTDTVFVQVPISLTESEIISFNVSILEEADLILHSEDVSMAIDEIKTFNFSSYLSCEIRLENYIVGDKLSFMEITQRDIRISAKSIGITKLEIILTNGKKIVYNITIT